MNRRHDSLHLKMSENLFESSSMSKKFPSYRKKLLVTSTTWLDGKRDDDNADGLWRIHDKLYDLVNFIQRHPGGADWLELTKGTDITELFETHHISRRAEIVLQNFYVEAAKKPRNYRTTFCDDGFYKTLKEKVAAKLTVTNKKVTRTSDVKTISKLLTQFE